jgi:glycosyltransferase involved in cell wall biosynthesis
MTKNILIISYYYPPLGGSGVQRTLKFAKYLQEKGNKVIVLTVGEGSSGVIDASLLNDLSLNIKVVRAKAGEPVFTKLLNKFKQSKSSSYEESSDSSTNSGTSGVQNKFKIYLKKAALKAYINLFIPDDKITWKQHAVLEAFDIIKRENIDVIYSTSAPYTSHLIALELKNKTGLPWVADFRDPWTTNRYADYIFITKYANKLLESKVINNADAVISVSKPIIEDFINRYPNTDAEKFNVITNGYDEQDFNSFNFQEIKTEKFVITYTGTMYGEDTPENFFKAIENLVSAGSLKVEDLLIRFVGRMSSKATEQIACFSSKYRDTIELIDYVPHEQSIKKLEESYALLFILNGGEECRGIYSGKIFEYIRTNRPIITIVPEGVARDLIIETNTGYCCYPDNISEIENAISCIYLMWQGVEPRLKVNYESVLDYERKALTNKLDKIIDNVLYKRSK